MKEPLKITEPLRLDTCPLCKVKLTKDNVKEVFKIHERDERTVTFRLYQCLECGIRWPVSIAKDPDPFKLLVDQVCGNMERQMNELANEQ